MNLINTIHRAEQLAATLFDEATGDSRLTTRQVAVLAAVANDGGASQIKLVEATGIDRSTLSDICNRLRKRGLINRTRTRADRRAYAVSLTDGGRAALRDAQKAIAATERGLIKRMPELAALAQAKMMAAE